MLKLPTLPKHPTDKAGDVQHWHPLQGAGLALATAELAKQSEYPVVLITESTASAYRLEQEIRFFIGELPVNLLPDWEILPYDTFSPHQDIVSDRLQALVNLPSLAQGVVIVPITTLMHRLAPKAFLQGQTLKLKKGDVLDIEALRGQLSAAGYKHVDTVYEHGEFTMRGAIFDIYPMGSKFPYRIDLFDDEIETLRNFDPETQRSDKRFDHINLLPAHEYPLDKAGINTFKDHWHSQFNVDPRECPVYQDVSDGISPAGIEYYLPLFFEQTDTLFDYLPNDYLIVNTAGIESAAEHFWKDASQRYEQRCGDRHRPILPPKQVLQSVPEVFSELKKGQRIVLHDSKLGDGAARIKFPISAAPELSVEAKHKDPVHALREFSAQQDKLLICAETAGRREALLDLFKRYKFSAEVLQDWQAFETAKKGCFIAVGGLESGLVIQNDKGSNRKQAIIAESQLFGQRVSQARRRKKATNAIDTAVRNLAELRIGSPVVHVDHGIGRYCGLQTIDIGEDSSEFLTLEYAEQTKLYVPVSCLHLISRYSGANADTVSLHRLGTDQWTKAKRKAAEKIRDVAAELLDIYARREARKGHSFNLDETDYIQFSADFPFEETPDQEAAIAAVVKDLKSDKPTDRLICGDVGFGKTEVAMRAAFVAVQNTKQVCILVPTTLLAQQHYESFRDRFADWPVNIEVLSRFRSAAEQKQILKDLEAGKIDILVGTHKLLSTDVKYSDLGLVIIDEEHRFGVRQKEHLKSLRSTVDVLTLTATPIPRTLNMSMSGMRDLSIIATPPSRRLSVKTFVRQSDDALIKEAILREILRGGQVYYLHNDVKSIEKTGRELQELVPELRIGIGHGQMGERQLEQVMSDFYHKKHNLLLCSTIIETGIDVPNANTIIIDRADKFGLAQLHQLRGRVGRSHHQAYAYLLTPDPKQLTGDAEKRLTAISEADDLGAGFTLATHDMEIRGAGELLGDDQSGQMHSIGFTLYMEMLERAVESIKSGKTPDVEHPLPDNVEVNLRVPALIPDDYLPDVQGRLILYKRIASAQSAEELDELQVEMIDRFGLLPGPAKNLFRVSLLKIQAEALGIKKLETSASNGRVEFGENTTIDPFTLVKLVQSQPATYRLEGATKLKFQLAMESHEERFEAIEQLLLALTPKA